jgi:hypothetical protein
MRQTSISSAGFEPTILAVEWSQTKILHIISVFVLGVICLLRILKKPTGPKLVKKFPTFYGTSRSIFIFTSAHHLTVS